MSVLDYFLDLVSYDTQSDSNSKTVPSTAGQKVLGEHLVSVMKDIGISDAFMDDKGYVYGSIPATKTTKNTIGFVAHMDTAEGVSGKDVAPQIIENYDGKDIPLNAELTLSPALFPSLSQHVGKTLIVTDGNTLLGGDDKAGIAEILMAAKEIIEENAEHGTIKIAFTPDEEIGRGADYFDVAGFACDYAYTVDGGKLGEVEYENFNAATATVTVKGRSVHPGSAKGALINSAKVAMELCSMLPENEAPEYTEGYEGFTHLISINGDTETTKMTFIIRDHDRALFEQKKTLLVDAAKYLNQKYEISPVSVEVVDSYYNMKEKIEPCMFIVDKPKDAMLKNDVEPDVIAIRGGTDGSRLSYMGLPCPNMCTGGYNCHGQYEYTVLEEMEKVKDIIKTIIKDVD